MRSFPRELLDCAREQHGVVTADQLRRARVIGRARTAAFSGGQLVPIHRGVYRLASHPSTFEQRCVAALLAAPDAAISGPTAGRIWGLRKVFTDDVHLIAGRAIELEGVAAHRTDLLSERDITVRFGVRVLRPARLLCDLASHLDDAALESVIEQALDKNLVTMSALRSHASRFMAPGRPGSIRLGRVLESRPGWLKPVDSDLELRLWRALSERGVVLERQVRVVLDGGEAVQIDLADRDARFGVEVDHVTWHGGRLDVQRDKRRDRALTRLGWTISRVTDDDIDHRLIETLDEIAAIAAQRAESASNPRKSTRRPRPVSEPIPVDSKLPGSG